MGINYDFVQTIVESVTAAGSFFAVCVALWTVYESQRPQVAVFLEHDRDRADVRLVVKNFGNGIARNIRISDFDFTLVQPELKEELERGFLSNGIPVLVPGASRDTILFAGRSALRQHDGLVTTVILSYEEKSLLGFSKSKSDCFELDTVSFYGSIYSNSDEYLTRIAVQSIDNTLKKQIGRHQ